MYLVAFLFVLGLVILGAAVFALLIMIGAAAYKTGQSDVRRARGLEFRFLFRLAVGAIISLIILTVISILLSKLL